MIFFSKVISVLDPHPHPLSQGERGELTQSFKQLSPLPSGEGLGVRSYIFFKL